MRQELLDQISDAADRVARGAGVDIADIEFLGGGRHRVLRVYIDKDAGVTLEDCETVSTALEALLDETDIIPGGQYTLEVSSPGVERKLTRPRDFEKSVGKKVKVVAREPVAGATTWTGMLQAFSGDVLTVESAEGKTAQIPLSQVKKANLKFEW
jgi:ribosome maturation factor RimP